MENEQESDITEADDATAPMVQTAGERLRAARQEKGLELSHVAAETRIPLRHLETIEGGHYDELPSRTYAIGFARNYAKAVEENEAEIVNLVREELAEGHGRQSALAGGMEPGDPAKLPSSGLAWASAIAAILLAVGAFAFYNTYFGAGANPASLIAESDEADDAEALAAAQGAAEDASDAAGPNPNGQVVFTALEDLWVRFYDQGYEDSGEPLFEGNMTSGDTFDLPRDADQPRINTGRPDALAITVDGESVPMLAEEPITIGDAPISAEALLARADTAEEPPLQLN